MQVVESRERARAPADVVWEVVARARDYPSWAGTAQAELEREGTSDPDGVGAVRRMTSKRGRRTVVVREEVVEFEPTKLFAYRLLSGIPVRDYEARVTLTEEGGATELHWRSQFRARIPGMSMLLRRVLAQVIAELTERAAREAERRAES